MWPSGSRTSSQNSGRESFSESSDPDDEGLGEDGVLSRRVEVCTGETGDRLLKSALFKGADLGIILSADGFDACRVAAALARGLLSPQRKDMSCAEDRGCCGIEMGLLAAEDTFLRWFVPEEEGVAKAVASWLEEAGGVEKLPAMVCFPFCFLYAHNDVQDLQLEQASLQAMDMHTH